MLTLKERIAQTVSDFIASHQNQIDSYIDLRIEAYIDDLDIEDFLEVYLDTCCDLEDAVDDVINANLADVVDEALGRANIDTLVMSELNSQIDDIVDSLS